MVYEGDWDEVNGQPDGVGKSICKSKYYYEGQFKAGKYHGKGRIIYEQGNWYEGSFLNGKYHGYGEYTFKNGDYYKGHYVKDRRNGIGEEKVMGKVERGVWKSGLQIKPIK